MGVGAILIPLFASLAGKVLGKLWDSASKTFGGSTPSEPPAQSGTALGFPAILQAGLAGRGGSAVLPTAPGVTGTAGMTGPVVANDAGRALALGQATWRAWYDSANPKLVADRYRDLEAV